MPVRRDGLGVAAKHRQIEPGQLIARLVGSRHRRACRQDHDIAANLLGRQDDLELGGDFGVGVGEITLQPVQFG